MILLAATLHTFRAHAVAFLHPQRQKQIGRGAVAVEHFSQQRERRDAVHIVIAEENDSFPAIDRVKNPVHGSSHLRQEERIAQRTEARLEKGVHFLGAAKAFPLQ